MIGELECPHWNDGSRNHPLSSTPRSTRQSSLPLKSHATSTPADPNTATTRLPSVTGVELAWLLFVCRSVPGDLFTAVRSQRIFPVALSRQYIFHSCTERSSTGLTSPYSPVRNVLSPVLLNADVTKMRLAHTIGLELAMPGMGVFHLMFLPLATSHSVTACWPSPLPLVPSPRNDGQLRGPVARDTAVGGAVAADGAAAAAAGAAAGASPVTRASVRFAAPCTRPTDSTRPPRPLNVSVAFTSL